MQPVQDRRLAGGVQPEHHNLHWQQDKGGGEQPRKESEPQVELNHSARLQQWRWRIGVLFVTFTSL